jgi:hypothetical protein
VVLTAGDKQIGGFVDVDAVDPEFVDLLGELLSELQLPGRG